MNVNFPLLIFVWNCKLILVSKVVNESALAHCDMPRANNSNQFFCNNTVWTSRLEWKKERKIIILNKIKIILKLKNYSSSLKALLEVPGGHIIKDKSLPDENHPSDHLPIAAIFEYKQIT